MVHGVSDDMCSESFFTHGILEGATGPERFDVQLGDLLCSPPIDHCYGGNQEHGLHIALLD